MPNSPSSSNIITHVSKFTLSNLITMISQYKGLHILWIHMHDYLIQWIWYHAATKSLLESEFCWCQLWQIPSRPWSSMSEMKYVQTIVTFTFNHDCLSEDVFGSNLNFPGHGYLVQTVPAAAWLHRKSMAWVGWGHAAPSSEQKTTTRGFSSP